MDKAIQAAALKPCPFCGKDELREYHRGTLNHCVACDWCEGLAPFSYWNRRAAIEAAGPILRTEERREIVEWLRKEARLARIIVNAEEVAAAIERGDHRKQIMDIETARDRTWP